VINIPTIQLQKLFLVTLILKVGSSFLGWYFQLQWSLGFAVPLLVMCAYILLGYYRRNSDVSDEKFADSCYYLGFIFTITSIIFSLFDLPNIGTHIQDIAVRFGAAMVSTVLGLGVRVYLVSFKQDIGDAIKDAEDAALDATRKFTEQLVIVLERLRDFESQVDTAARSTVERVNLQVENLSKNHADKLAEFFTDLTAENQKAFKLALAEVKTASRHLADSVDGYAQGMRSNLTSIETKVGAFTEAVTDRLKTTTFPDDYFARHLAAPLVMLTESASELTGGVKKASVEVNQSSVVLSGALKKLRDKANAVEGSLDNVLMLTKQQQAVLDSAQGQLTTLGQLSNNLVSFDVTLTNTLSGIVASNTVNSDLASRISNVVEEGVMARNSLQQSLADVIGRLDSTTRSTTTVAEKLDANATASLSAVSTIAAKLDEQLVATNAAASTIASQLSLSAIATESVATKLVATAIVSESIAGKLDALATADVQTSATLGTIGLHANTAIGKFDQAVVQLQDMVSQLSSLDGALRTQSSDLKQVVEQIKDVKIVIEMPQQSAPKTYPPLPESLLQDSNAEIHLPLKVVEPPSLNAIAPVSAT
jgi:hypothetical protein